MVLLSAVALLFVPQDLKETHGKTNAQILAMGRKNWGDFYTEKEGGAVTITISDSEMLYADALGSRNDRYGKAKIGRLRKLLQDTARDASEVGRAITGGGTMWTIVGASLMTDGEETLYAVLSGKGKTPKHVVSDVNKAYEKIRRELQSSELPAETKKQGQESLKALRRDFNGLIAEAARRPRKPSDAILDFCVKTVAAVQGA